MGQPGFESPQTAQAITRPSTRVMQAWAHMWHGIFRDGRKKIERTHMYADAIRRIR